MNAWAASRSRGSRYDAQRCNSSFLFFTVENVWLLRSQNPITMSASAACWTVACMCLIVCAAAVSEWFCWHAGSFVASGWWEADHGDAEPPVAGCA